MDLVISEMICDSCWEPLDDLDLWEMDDVQEGYIVCSKCEET